MDTFPNAKVVSNFGTGYEFVDCDAAIARGMPVGHTPGCLSETVRSSWCLLPSVCVLVYKRVREEPVCEVHPPFPRSLCHCVRRVLIRACATAVIVMSHSDES